MIDGRTYLKYRLLGNKAFITNEEKRFFILFFIIAMFKFAYYGYAYIPFLDDYVQYGLYPNLGNVAEKVFINGAKTIYTRPFATVADVYIIGKLGLDGLGIALFCISVLYAASALLFYISFKAINMRLTILFPIIYTLSPITTEGVYWVSAASRIVTSLFFAALFLYFAVRFKKTKSKNECKGKGCFDFIYKTALMWLCNALSYGFYEQTAILSYALTVFFSVKLKERRVAIIGVLNFVLLVVYYLLFSTKGDNAERVTIQSFKEIFASAPLVGAEIYKLWFTHSIRLSIVAFWRGFEILVSDKAIWWLIIMSALVLCIFITMNKIKIMKLSPKNSFVKRNSFSITRFFFSIISKNEKLLVGIILFTVSYIPFFITGSTWLNFRNLTPSMLGFSLIADAVAERLIKSSEAKSFVATVLIVFFLVGNVSEIRDYSNVAYSDYKIAEKISQSVEPKTTLVKVTLKRKDEVGQNLKFNDHIIGICETDYGICGAVRALSGNYGLKTECEFVD